MSGKKFSVDLHLPFHQVIIMPRIIPCKVLRKVKWITKFIEKKAATEKKILTVHKLVVYDIYPKAKNILTFSRPSIFSIWPPQRQLLLSKPVFTDIPPEVPNYDLLPASILE